MTKPSTSQRVLAHLNLISPDACSIPEIAADLKLSPATVRAVVKIHVQDGRAIPLGISSSNARCYGITKKGKEGLT